MQRLSPAFVRFVRRTTFALVVVLPSAVAFGVDGSPPRNHDAQSESPAEQRARAATVRLRVTDARGQSFGTGTIIDQHDDEVLVLTCGHLFRESQEKSGIECELFVNGVATSVPGTLISHDLRRDVGLIGLKPGIRVDPVPVGGGGCLPKEGDDVFTIGCSKGADPSLMRNRIRAVNRYHGPANLVVGGRPIDGRSGGGLFSRDGVLIGVCNAADLEQDEGVYAALGPIHTELDTAGLGFIYRREVPTLATRGEAPQSSPVSDNGPPQPTRGADSKGTELICILRNPQDEQGSGKVFVLDRPSAEFLRSLSSELARRGPHAPTSGHVAPPRVRRLPRVDLEAPPQSSPGTDRSSTQPRP